MERQPTSATEILLEMYKKQQQGKPEEIVPETQSVSKSSWKDINLL